MIRPTVIVTQPTQIDFPLFRTNMFRFQQYFEEIIIDFFKGAEEPDYSGFWQGTMGDIATFVRTPQTGGDWRNNTVNDMLSMVKTEYVLFLEQDFLIRDQRLLEVVLNGVMDYNTILYDEGGRTHPAFALVPTELINKTSKDFAANPQSGYDHFGKFFRELEPLASHGDLVDLGLESRVDF